MYYFNTKFPTKDSNIILKPVELFAIYPIIIVTMCDINYADILLSFYYGSIKELDIKSFLCIAFNYKSTYFALKHGIPVALYYVKDSEGWIDTNRETDHYWTKTKLKWKMMELFLEKKITILMTDSDIKFLKNPLNYIPQNSDDITCMKEMKIFDKINTGFM